MITSSEWNNTKWSNDPAGKRLTSIILQERFWRNIVYALKLTGPLVKVLRMVDGDKKPAMGYIYESMDRAKETIALSFLHKEEHYKKAFEYIDARWDCQLHRPLHAAGFFLNPEMYYENPENAMCVEVMNGLYACIQRLVPDLSTQYKIGEQLDLYQNAQGLFGNPMAVRQRKKRAPVLRVARGTGAFFNNFIQKGNRLAQSRLNDMVYVKFNRALRRRYQRKDTTDPILLKEIDESNEWLMGHMDDEDGEEDDFVFDGDDLTWSAVDKAYGASQATYSTRRTSTSSSSRDRGKGVAQTSTRRRPSTGLNLIDEDDEEIEQDIGLSEDDGEEEVLDEADTMFDRVFGSDIHKFLVPLKNRALKPNGQGFQTILVTATITKAVQKLIDEEFQGIEHLRTSTLHKKVASARHDFIKLSGSENKLEALLQVLEPSLTKGNRVMVFCNTLNSSLAVDHFLGENQIFTVNYHGEVPAEQRVENLNKFKSDDGDCPTLACTDLAARGLDLDVNHGSLDQTDLFFMARYRLAAWFLAVYKETSILMDCLICDPALGDCCANSRSSVIKIKAWTRPPKGYIKLNVDAAVTADWRKSGVGGILRVENGSVVGSFQEASGPGPPILIELMAIKKGLFFFASIQQQFEDRLIVETDSKIAVDWIKNYDRCPNVYVDLVNEIVTKLRGLGGIIRWVAMSANVEADALAKAGSLYDCSLSIILEDARKAINCVDRSWIQGNKVRVFMARYHPRDVFWRKKFSGPYPVEGKSLVEDVSHTEAPIVGSVDEIKLSTLKDSLVGWFKNFIKMKELATIMHKEGDLNNGSFDRALLQIITNCQARVEKSIVLKVGDRLFKVHVSEFEPCFNPESVWVESSSLEEAVASPLSKVGELVGVSPVKYPELEVGAEEAGRIVHSSEMQFAERCSEKEEKNLCCMGNSTRGSFLSGEGVEDRNIGEEMMMGPRSAVVGQGMVLSQLEEVGEHETLLVHGERSSGLSRELEDVSLKDKVGLLVHAEREKEDAYRKSSELARAFEGSKDYYIDFPMLDGRVESKVVEDGFHEGLRIQKSKGIGVVPTEGCDRFLAVWERIGL
ncbi:polyubiquitin family protein [Hibiscus syriacus]|uniref:Polyubiquitin family protein n=1 Tax=Hibiscus syriacus TaxID=106335 RepID=A0A6A3CLU9_HIBSY|nr:polyubiquitin family protein [Hibiscus syriacus]